MFKIRPTNFHIPISIDTLASPSRDNVFVLQALLGQLRAMGVSECCVAAGARNAAIIAALHRALPGFKIRHFFEERSAAFFALGRVIETRKPVAVVTTSGTAAAELLPAMIEAHYQAMPLVAVTADRPECYARSGAPQAIEQGGLFGVYATWSYEISVQGIEQRGSGGSGPIHINVRLAEGLPELAEEALAGGANAIKASELSAAQWVQVRHEWDQFWKTDHRTVVLVAGLHPEDAVEAMPLLRRLGVPIVAEATANLPGDAPLQLPLLAGGEMALQGGDFSRVLRIGGVPSWRWWRDLEDRPAVPVLSISRADFRGLARQRDVCTLPWDVLAEEWHLPSSAPTPNPAGGAIAARLDEVLAAHPESEPGWIRHLSQLVPAGAQVFLGNSLPIREWNFAAAWPQSGVQFFANRGANGIDGLISTWLGLSAEASESWCIIGDLSALYDLSAPWILAQLPQAKRRLVVINNGGGKIFSRVAWLAGLPEEVQGIIENRHELRFEAVAKLWGLRYRCFDKIVSVPQEDTTEPGTELWEILPQALETAAFWNDWSRSAASGG